MTWQVKWILVEKKKKKKNNWPERPFAIETKKGAKLARFDIPAEIKILLWKYEIIKISKRLTALKFSYFYFDRPV